METLVKPKVNWKRAFLFLLQPPSESKEDRGKGKEKQGNLQNLCLKKCSFKLDYKNHHMKLSHIGVMFVP